MTTLLISYPIMLRERLEAALIVGIVARCLKQTGRSRFMPAVWTGVGLAVAVCAALGGLLGYQESPTVGQVALCLALLVPALWLLLAPARRAAPTPRPA